MDSRLRGNDGSSRKNEPPPQGSETTHLKK